ncbi:MAG: MotA/TolQ/ExbB proton channel family protein [Planctomycetes bacterium]|nr:MotA/TolQ/ExbB proton channel family protein [Planctomycetota bacterium]
MNAMIMGISRLTLAQVNAGQAAEAVEIQSIWDFVTKGGPMMIPIGIASLVALAVIVERFVSLRRRKVIPPGFLPSLRSALNDGSGNANRALEFCKTNGSPVANVFAAGIKRLHEPVALLEKHIGDAGEREVFKLRKNVRVLSVIASVAPLLGLLGTIFGMITAFQTVAMSAEALGKTELLAKGIYEAMITTAAGLSVAIPALIGHHWISAKIEHLVTEIDQMTVDFVEEFAGKSRVRGVAGEELRITNSEERIGRPMAPEGVKDEAVRAGGASGETDSGPVAAVEVAVDGKKIDDLPAGARVATS